MPASRLCAVTPTVRGLQLALSCDFRIFAEGTKVGLIETRYGLLPDMGATVRLPRIVGESRARELILLGEVIDADEALRIGLANRVVADAISTPRRPTSPGASAAQPPLAVRGAGGRSTRRWHRGPEESFPLALEEQLRCLGSEDFTEALQAMVEAAPRSGEDARPPRSTAPAFAGLSGLARAPTPRATGLRPRRPAHPCRTPECLTSSPHLSPRRRR